MDATSRRVNSAPSDDRARIAPATDAGRGQGEGADTGPREGGERQRSRATFGPPSPSIPLQDDGGGDQHARDDRHGPLRGEQAADTQSGREQREQANGPIGTGRVVAHTPWLADDSRFPKKPYSAPVVQHSQPLRGIVVVDFSQNLPGPYATMVLRSMGAEVVKVEPPHGDAARIFPRMFEILGAGKQSVAADLKDPLVAQAVGRVIAKADVVVEGFRPGVMDRFGLGPQAMTTTNERLVYCSISGFGQQGPYRDMPGHDLNFQALTGVCHMLRDARGRPMGGALPFGDLSAAMTAVTAILGALVERGSTGRGQVLDVAMVDALMSWTYVWSEGLTPADASLADVAEPTAEALRRAASAMPGALGSVFGALAQSLASGRGRSTLDAVGERLRRTKRVQSVERLRLHTLPHYTVYRCSDGRYLSIGIVDEDKFWRSACDVLQLSGAGGLPLWGRFLAAAGLRKRIAAKIAAKPLAHWVERFGERGVPVAPVLTVEEALIDPQLRTRRPEHGPVRGPWSVGAPIDAPVPRLGEHTARWLD